MKRHHHSGKSSAGFLNYTKIIDISKIRDDSNIIDIGCKMGDFVIALAKSSKVKQIYALDIFIEGIEKLKEKIREKSIKNIICVNEDITQKTSLPEIFFDYAFMIDVFHGFYVNKECELVLRELRRILKPGGRVITVDFRKYIPLLGPPISERVSTDDLKNIFESNGYKTADILGLGLTHYLIIFDKK